MTLEPKTIDPKLILQKIKFYEGEIARLKGLVEAWDSFAEFATDALADDGDAGKKVGRPRSENNLVPVLKELLADREEPISTTELRILLISKSIEEKGKLVPAMNDLVAQSWVYEIQKPRGQRPGIYQWHSAYEKAHTSNATKKNQETVAV